MLDLDRLNYLLKNNQEEFWILLSHETLRCNEFSDVLFLSALRNKAFHKFGDEAAPNFQPKKIAILSGVTLHPFNQIIMQLSLAYSIKAEVFLYEYNYIQEIVNPSSKLYQSKPDVVLLIPDPYEATYPGNFSDPLEVQKQFATNKAKELLEISEIISMHCNANIVLCNYPLPPDVESDLERSRSLFSSWSYKKYINFELGLLLPPRISLIDAEFISCQIGTKKSEDIASWLESKQMGTHEFQLRLAKEFLYQIRFMTIPTKKVLILDLDNTLWGGVIADDGLEGIHIGAHSHFGEAFQLFQKYIISLYKRGILLAVCSKNSEDNAKLPFYEHSGMLLKMEHFVSFKANFRPKSDNIIDIANELNLSLDSFVFVDDNPAEIEIVNQFLPEVQTILLDGSPESFISKVKSKRFFDVKTITFEDMGRSNQYIAKNQEQLIRKNFANMATYLSSLEMKSIFHYAEKNEIPRIHQLINKSNQFNLTSKRRTMNEVCELLNDSSFQCYTFSLQDKFVDHGLIAICIVKFKENSSNAHIDTLLMSCRVLERGVEQEFINKIIQDLAERKISQLHAEYLPTSKNSLVKDLYKKLNFSLIQETENISTYQLTLEEWVRHDTFIH